MSASVNKVILVGHLGKDPEVRYTPGGMAIANITLATNEFTKDKQTGQQQDKTEWHRITFFDRLAEIVGQYLRKGSLIYVEGRLQTRKWQDQSGADRWTTEIIANVMQMLGGKGDATANYASTPNASSGNTMPSMPPSSSEYQPNYPSANAAPVPTTPSSTPATTAPRGNPPPTNFDDDIPF